MSTVAAIVVYKHNDPCRTSQKLGCSDSLSFRINKNFVKYDTNKTKVA
jgi:hypothetical protein